MQDFVAAIRGGPPPETAGSDNRRSLAMVFGAIESAETGLPVDIGAEGPGPGGVRTRPVDHSGGTTVGS